MIIKGKYFPEIPGSEWVHASLNIATGDVQLEGDIEDEDGVGTIFVRSSGMVMAIDVTDFGENEYVAHGGNFELLQRGNGLAPEYLLIKVHELNGGLSYVHYILRTIAHSANPHEIAEEELAAFYGEGNSEPTSEHRDCTVVYTNGACGKATFKYINKEEFNVLSKYL